MVIDAKHIVPLAITAFSSNDTDTAATSVLSPSVIILMNEGEMEYWWAFRPVEQNKRHVSTRQIRGKNLRTRSNYRERVNATSRGILPDVASSVPFD
eukprot:scaffold9887_cov133-Skeletonema_marinoi.AAC.1